MAERKPSITPNAEYFNVMRISHTGREFYFDIAQTGMEAGTANLLSRLVTTPGHAKSVLVALTAQIRKYEGKFGEIEPEAPSSAEIQ